MESEQRFNIPLDSPLDINSNDMLVPASSPKFAFNRQRFLGSVLQNSVRFEADGWFAGWWLHNFDLVSIGYYTVSPDGLGDPQFQTSLVPGEVYSDTAARYWTLKFKDVQLEFQFNLANQPYIKVATGGAATVTRINDQTVRVIGSTNKNTPVGFIADVNAYTGALISFTCADPSLTATTMFVDGVFKITISPPFTVGNDYMWLRYGEDASISDGTYTYSFDGTRHKWGSLLFVTGDTLTIDPASPAYTLKSWVLRNPGVVSEYFDVVLESIGTFTIKEEIQVDLFGGMDSIYDAIPNIDNATLLVDELALDADKITAPDAVTRVAILKQSFTPGPIIPTTWDSKAVAGYALPIWLKISIGYTFEFELEVRARYAEYYDYRPSPNWPYMQVLTLIPAHYDCIPWVRISRAPNASSVQNGALNDFGTAWTAVFAGQTFSEADIPVGGSLRISLSGGNVISNLDLPRSIVGDYYCVATNPDPLSPIPLGTHICTAHSTHAPKWPSITDVPRPPPDYAQLTLSWQKDGNIVNRGNNPPVGWRNPVSYYPAWPAARPPEWQNPIVWPAAWPAAAPAGWSNPSVYTAGTWPTPAPVDWQNQIVWNSLNWPTTPPTDWDVLLEAWPPIWPVGIDTAPPAWAASGTTEVYATYIAALQPTGWPAGKPWPVTPQVGYQPVVAGAVNPTPPADWLSAPWPPFYPYGIASAPGAGVWNSVGTPYAVYLDNNKPLDWPLRKAWPVVPEGGWNPYAAGAVNPTAPTAWAPVPWPIDYWPFGITTTPPNNNGFSTWYSTNVTYAAYLAANKPVFWPITMTNMWPVTPEAGYIPATNWTVNPVQPEAWIPPWPPNWPFGIGGIPSVGVTSEWYMNNGVSYNQYIQAYKPADWPIPWGWYIRTPGDNWPLYAEAAWRPRTPAAWNGAINPAAPAYWTPPWPIQWPYGITTPPPAWYTWGSGLPDGDSYIGWLQNNIPDRAYGANSATDPGWIWPIIDHPVKAVRQINGIWTTSCPWPLTPDTGWQPYVAYDPVSGQMVVNLVPPPNWPQYLLLEIEVPGTLTYTYINTNLGPRVPVLNARSLFADDKNALQYVSAQSPWWTVTLNVVLPICTYGYTFQRVTTTDITLCAGNINAASFAIEEVGNSELGFVCFRLDSDAGRLYNGQPTKYALVTLVGTIQAVGNNNGGPGSPVPKHLLFSPYKISIGFTNLRGILFDKVTSYHWDGEPNQQTGDVQVRTPLAVRKAAGFYPAWCVPDAPCQIYWKTYDNLGADKGFGYALLVTITYFAWLKDSATPSHTFAPNSATNQQLDARLSPVWKTLDGPRPGVFTQHGNINFGAQSGGGTVGVTYLVVTSTATYTPNTAPWTWVSGTCAYKDPVVNIVLTVTRSEEVQVKLYRSFIIGKAGLLNSISMVSADANLITLNTPYGFVRRDGTWDANAGAYLTLVQKTVAINHVRIDVSEANDADIRFLPEGIWRYNKLLTFKSITVSGLRNRLVFEYAGVEYTVVFDAGLRSLMDYSVYDVRNAERKSVYTRDTTDIKMYLKQHWSNDVRTENYWWIDSEHVLELTKYDLILHEKVKDPKRPGKYQLHDWNADCWKVVQRNTRGTFFDTPDVYYNVSSTLDDIPALFKCQVTATGIRVKYIRNIMAINFSLFVESDWSHVDIPLAGNLSALYPLPPAAPIAIPLRNDAISAYMPIDANAMLLTSKVSSTVIHGQLILGFAMTRGSQQWAVKINMANKTFAVHNGYGHVGHDGSLTGGLYPAICIPDAQKGFSTAVHSISEWQDDLKDGIGVENQVYGSGSTLWFIYAELQDFVSHLTYSISTTDITGASDKWAVVKLPLATNYHMANERSTYKSSAMYDTVPRSLGMLDLFTAGGADDSSGASTALSYLSGFLLPSLWYMLPFCVLSCFSAQGRHNVAYVWRNKLPTKSDDGKSDKAVTVTRNLVEQSTSLNVARTNALVNIILSIIGEVAATSGDELTANASIGANAVQDTSGRKFGQMAAGAVLDSVASSFKTSGLVVSAKTSTKEVISTDMFYSIDDGCECWAGPGFVNHNLLGQAVVQGESHVRWQIYKFGMYLPLEFISRLTVIGQSMMYKLLLKGLDRAAAAADGIAAGAFGLGTGAIIPIGPILSGIVGASATAVDAILVMYEWLEESGIPAIFKIFGDVARGFVSGGVQRATTEVEATHSYGNKPVSLFWPAFGAVQDTLTIERVQSKILWQGSDLKLSGFIGEVALDCAASSKNNISVRTAHAGTRPNDWYFMPQSEMSEKTQLWNYMFDDLVYLPKDVTVATSRQALIPDRMACVEGIVNMLPTTGELKNLQVNNCMYTFPTPPIHDYRIPIKNVGVELGVQAATGEIISYSSDDVKLIDGPASNIVDVKDFFGIASSYIALEVKDKYDSDYLRPWAITPTCIALNINGINTVQDAKAYHAFDGQFNRIVSWKGGNGLDSATLVQQYAFIINNHFKRSNIIPPSEFFGLFNGPPAIRLRAINEQIVNQVMDATRQKGLEINTPGEDRDATRFSLPIHSETLSTLPAVVRMLAPYRLHVIDGITSLTTDIRTTQTKYKAPSSIDFNIYDTMYRATEEYISILEQRDGIVAVLEKVPSAGLTFIGATTKEAFFYSPATRMYYSFSGAGDISKRDILNRFKDVKVGRWDFVNQEVMFKALLNDGILTSDVDGWMVARLDKDIAGEVTPPNETVYRLPDWDADVKYGGDFKLYSMAGGTVYQGPKRCIVNRFVILDSMYTDIKANKKRWQRVDREVWSKPRDYKWQYEDWNTSARANSVFGWTHNAYRLATAYLGTAEDTDQIFEWELTFCWTEQIEKLFEQNEFISFNVQGATYTQGGLIEARPSHIFLYKDLFRNGYYTMRYQSKNGMGNRERLYLWGDGISALESLVLYTKEGTKRRTQPLATSQVDVQELQEQ